MSLLFNLLIFELILKKKTKKQKNKKKTTTTTKHNNNSSHSMSRLKNVSFKSKGIRREYLDTAYFAETENLLLKVL